MQRGTSEMMCLLPVLNADMGDILHFGMGKRSSIFTCLPEECFSARNKLNPPASDLETIWIQTHVSAGVKEKSRDRLIRIEFLVSFCVL